MGGRQALIVLVALLSPGAASCRSRSAQDSSSRASTDSPPRAELLEGTFTGIGGFGREAQAFLPCGISQEWWLEFDRRWPELDKRLAEQEATDLSARLEDCERKTGMVGCDKWVYLEFDGVRSGPGRYGHMGGYSRELRVTKVSRVTRAVPDGCAVRRLTRR